MAADNPLEDRRRLDRFSVGKLGAGGLTGVLGLLYRSHGGIVFGESSCGLWGCWAADSGLFGTDAGVLEGSGILRGFTAGLVICTGMSEPLVITIPGMCFSSSESEYLLT